MAASMKDEKSDCKDKNQAQENPSIHPNVNFLYKTMLQRDPRKRRVKPVADSLVQINFGGLDDEDSEEDSDFDIGQHSHDSAAADSLDEDEMEESLGSDEMKEDNGETIDDKEDEDNSDEGDMPSGAKKYKKGNKRSANIKSSSAADDADVEDDGGNENFENESDSEHEDDEMEETSDDFETDENESDEDTGDDGNNDGDDDEEADSIKAESPEIKGLGQVLDMIDSDEDDEDYVPKKKKKKSTVSAAQKATTAPKKSKVKSKKGKKSETSKASSEQVTAVPSQAETAPQARIKVIVCCVCLSDRSGDEDEIVECDNCGIAVHEGCYGISESHSTASTVSSASTEPWFCDACKANAEPVCELCPNSGGIFKETDNGKWVHIVCALYTPGVAFGDVDRLSLVTLFEMPYSKWGAKECSLCEDSRFSQTGVCINCDAGMCKAYFHVTCAQREGLLAEVTPEEVMEVADPFFAYCKLHADKITSKIKRRNWLAIQSHVKTHKPSAVEDGAEKLRFQRKLRHHRDKYEAAKLKKPPSWVPAQKMVRHLHTSPSAVRSFLKKAELMGVITQAQTVPLESQEMRKKTQGQPAFTADFISYFMERNMKVDNLKTVSVELSSQNKTLQNQERVVRKKYDKLTETVKELQLKGASLRKEGESLCGMLQNIYGKPVPNIPDIFKTKKRMRSPSKKEATTPDSVVIHQCGICTKTKQQHLMAKCDSCKKHFHLGCLNPPLTRMPKKTKLFGWQCSFCALSSSDGSVKSAPDPDQPRKLRETIKEPDKFFHLSHVQESLDSQRKKSILNRKSKQRRQSAKARRAHRQKQLRKNSASDSGSKKPPSRSPVKVKGKLSPSTKKVTSDASSVDHSVHPSPSKRSSGKPPENDPLKLDDITSLDIMCVVCNGAGSFADTIRCDECKLSYHLACLDPPVKKSPKVRGYVWHCEACDMMESSEDDRPPRGKKNKKQQQPPDLSKSPITLASGREGREASNSILFDIDVSSDDQ
ncbi:hypothetical protein RRG08_052252 [Elysia crispata]|uniref:PHD finger protein 14 n=1 Tax=Elysia crispata TaxID=231223 RepID=A0AAE1AXG7_9GAST|nr:hypothetical protein RRG08_052252 [Elysia crispata]